jgi:hypothetical protein
MLSLLGWQTGTESRIALTSIQTILAGGTAFATLAIAIVPVMDLLMRP